MSASVQGLARQVDGIPTVASATDRDAAYPTPSHGQKVYNIATGDLEMYDIALLAWTTIIAGIGSLSFSGTGSPEGVVAAVVGSDYRQTNGSNGTILWVKNSGTGTTGWAVVGLLTATTWYVDSVSGSDSRSGRTAAQALLTIAAVLAMSLQAGDTIMLARGSTWREQLTAPNGVAVLSYGTGALPILDAADVAANASFTKTGGFTFLYDISWSHSMVVVGINKFSVWENGVRLTRAATQAASDAAAGSFFAPTPVAAQTQTISVHASDNSSVITNGKLYEISRREKGILAGDDCSVQYVRTKRNGHDGGSCIGGRRFYAKGVVTEDGTVHNFQMASGLAEDCIAWKGEGYAAAGSSTRFVSYVDDASVVPLSEQPVYRRCYAIDNSNPTTNGTVGFFCHDASGPAYALLTLDECKVYGAQTAMGGVATTYRIVNAEITRYMFAFSTTSTTLIVDGALVLGDDVATNDVLSQCLLSGAGQVVADFNEVRCVQRRATGGLIFTNTATTDVRIRKSTLAFRDPTSSPQTAVKLNTAGANLTIAQCIIDGATIKLYDLSAGVTLAAGNNVLFPEAGDLTYNGSTYTTVALYQAANPTLDANSISDDPLLPSNVKDGNFTLPGNSPAIPLGAGSTRVTAPTDWATLIAALPTL